MFIVHTKYEYTYLCILFVFGIDYENIVQHLKTKMYIPIFWVFMTLTMNS